MSGVWASKEWEGFVKALETETLSILLIILTSAHYIILNSVSLYYSAIMTDMLKDNDRSYKFKEPKVYFKSLTLLETIPQPNP